MPREGEGEAEGPAAEADEQKEESESYFYQQKYLLIFKEDPGAFNTEEMSVRSIHGCITTLWTQS